VAVAAAITLGVAPLVLAQTLYGGFFFLGWLWVAVVPLLVFGYYGTYQLAFRGERLGPQTGRMAAGVTLAFLGVAFFYVLNMSMLLRPDRIGLRHQDGRWSLPLSLTDRTFAPRYLHVVVGAVAVAGLGIALLGVLKRANEPAFAAWAIRRGTVCFGFASALNVAVGLWFLLSQPDSTLVYLTSGSPWAAAILGFGVVLGLAVPALAPLALRARDPARATWTLVEGLAMTLLVMVLLRDQLREAALHTAGLAAGRWVAPQWGPIALVVVLLLVAVATVAWTMALVARGKTES
jgi:hypothetical protein